MSKTNYVIVDATAKSKEEAIQICGQALQEEGLVEEDFAKLCLEREKEFPTGLPAKIPTAIPHAKSDRIHDNGICVLRLQKPVTFFRMDEDQKALDVEIVFNLAIKDPNAHLGVLQRLMDFFASEENLIKVQQLSKQDLRKFLEEEIG
ncbi:MAG: PTS sugar transporter subunit IIA [Peptoniphilaceae bacterium]|nr:PTS sugar transporter subunit IIA [Peptoniphilaceae bacterium]MDD7434488.1 PTS sugar transporter subunit IIA [Peptoniphilaceae bacterium]MDY3076475.1 PTS sugar transporter subunit IIA [Peptoniphilaceae bacterium]